MSVTDPDIIVIGSGPNGLSAACSLAQQGFQVLVLEQNPLRPGGALGSDELTLPGFVHDVGAGFFPFGKLSPAFQAFRLEELGVEWLHAKYESCHPALDGSQAAIARRDAQVVAPFGCEQDTATWAKLVGFHQRTEPHLLQALLRPFPELKPWLKLGAGNVLRLLRIFGASGRGLSERLFSSEAARRVMPSLALHVDVGPDDWFSAGLGYILGVCATSGGFAVPRRGAQSITNALITLLERFGGRLQLDTRVVSILIEKSGACGVRLASGEQIRCRQAVVADTSAPGLFLDLIDRHLLPGHVIRSMKKFPIGFGTFKVDWALSARVPWQNAVARESAVVHAGESLDDLSNFVRTVRSGKLAEKPYLVVGQQSLCDPSRAPAGQHTLYCYSRVPSTLEDGWDAQRERYADVIEERLEQLAPGFRSTVLARHVTSPPDLEQANPNLLGGNLGGGSNAWNRQLLFRPVFPYFRYRTPIRKLYLSSSYAHPGAGVHGMCGYNAAAMVARDLD